MKKIYCDRCGKEIGVHEFQIPSSIKNFPTRKNAGGYNDVMELRDVDLCGNCTYMIGMWLAKRVRLDDGRYWGIEDVQITKKEGVI